MNTNDEGGLSGYRRAGGLSRWPRSAARVSLLFRRDAALNILYFFLFTCSCLGGLCFSCQTAIADSQNVTLPTPALICTTNNEKAWVSVSGFCHLLMFYGLEETDLPGFPTGRSMLKALTEEDAAIKAFGKSPFVRTRNGIRYYLFNDSLLQREVGEVHRDQCLATFAQLNLPLDTPMHAGGKTHAIANLLSEAIANFDMDEKEPAWTAIALAKYIPPEKDWVDRFGKRTSFSQLARRLLKVDSNTQSCGGTHIFEALGLIAKADLRSPILNSETRRQLNTYLAAMLHEIVQRQQADGSWNKGWCGEISNDGIGRMATPEERVLVTGHLFGILHEVDYGGYIPNDVYIRASKWLSECLSSKEAHPINSWLCPFTHAALAVREATALLASDRLPVFKSLPRRE